MGIIISIPKCGCENQAEAVSVVQNLLAWCPVPSRGKNVNYLLIFPRAVFYLVLGPPLDPVFQVPLDSLYHMALWLSKQPYGEGLVCGWEGEMCLEKRP